MFSFWLLPNDTSLSVPLRPDLSRLALGNVLGGNLRVGPGRAGPLRARPAIHSLLTPTYGRGKTLIGW